MPTNSLKQNNYVSVHHIAYAVRPKSILDMLLNHEHYSYVFSSYTCTEILLDKYNKCASFPRVCPCESAVLGLWNNPSRRGDMWKASHGRVPEKCVVWETGRVRSCRSAHTWTYPLQIRQIHQHLYHSPMSDQFCCKHSFLNRTCCCCENFLRIKGICQLFRCLFFH